MFIDLARRGLLIAYGKCIKYLILSEYKPILKESPSSIVLRHFFSVTGRFIGFIRINVSSCIDGGIKSLKRLLYLELLYNICSVYIIKS